MNMWSKEAFIYHIYPLGFCNAPKHNDFLSDPIYRIEKVYEWIEHIKFLGADTIYFGPIFESTSHGYDTKDYFLVDRRLGNNDTFSRLSKSLHDSGIRIVLDGVFNHVGRDFWAFKDVLANGQKSIYCDWFYLDFKEKSLLGDPFNYNTWNGYYHLVKLNLSNPEVKWHIFKAVKAWVDEFDIDGLRLDCADCLDFNFISELSYFCKIIKPEFWLIGEVLRGKYSSFISSKMLDSVTNYECYKGLFSSHNDKNYFEIAHSLDRQFGEGLGICKNLYLYNFADNHDVNRIGSMLKKGAHLYPLHAILFTMPGIPSIYYGSEWGIEGERNGTDYALRPSLDLSEVSSKSPNKDLALAISRFAQIRKNSAALKYGKYIPIKVMPEQFAFSRVFEDECMIIIANSSDKSAVMNISLPVEGKRAVDILNGGEAFEIEKNKCCITDIYPCWARILKVER